MCLLVWPWVEVRSMTDGVVLLRGQCMYSPGLFWKSGDSPIRLSNRRSAPLGARSQKGGGQRAGGYVRRGNSEASSPVQRRGGAGRASEGDQPLPCVLIRHRGQAAHLGRVDPQPCALGAPVQAPSGGGASAANTYATQRKSWPGGTTSSSLAVDHSGRTSRTR